MRRAFAVLSKLWCLSSYSKCPISQGPRDVPDSIPVMAGRPEVNHEYPRPEKEVIAGIKSSFALLGTTDLTLDA